MSYNQESMKRENILAILHDSFEISLTLKAILAVLETIAGLILLVLGPDKITDFLAALSQGKMVPGHDLIIRYFLSWASQYSISTHFFIAFYLISHGVIKLLVIGSLWKEKIWAFPLGITLFFLFIIYQIYRYTFTHSLWLIIISFFDIIVIYLTWKEYQRIKTKLTAWK